MQLVELKLNTATHELFVGEKVFHCDVLVVDGVRMAVEALAIMTHPRRDSLIRFVRSGNTLTVSAMRVLSVDGEVVPEMVLDVARALEVALKESNG
jgi:hypothetical protein